MEKLEEADRYIEGLSKIFSGEILLISDHGMHETRDGGNHGESVLPCAVKDKHERSSCLYAMEDMLAIWGERI